MKQPQGKPPQSKPTQPKGAKGKALGKPPKPSKVSGKAKAYETSKTAGKQSKEKPKEKPLVVRKQSFLKENASNTPKAKLKAIKVIPKTSTPRDDKEGSVSGNEDHIQAVADGNVPLDEASSQTTERAEAELFTPTDPQAELIARLESKGAVVNVVKEEEDDKDAQKEEIEVEEVADDKNYPTICRRCYINFSTQTSPVCNHRFCDECYAKCQNSVTYSKDGLEEKIAFQCFACTKVATEEKKDLRNGSRISPVFEHCAEGVEKVYAFSSYAFLNPQKLAVCVDKEGESMLVVDEGCGKILILNASGELRQFSYLKNYRFQGGVDIINETVLLSLQNEKYSSISFYDLDGGFKFSAFLDTGAEVPHLLSNSDREIIALDTTANNLDIINQEKRVHKQKYLSENEVLHPSAMAIHPHNDNLYIFDGNNECISVFDTRYLFLFKFSLSYEKNVEGPILGDPCDKTVRLIIDNDSIILRVQKSRILAYSIEGEYISDIVVLIPNPNSPLTNIKSMKPCIRDASLCGPGKLAVLMVGGETTGEIRVYSYSIPGKYKVKPLLSKFRRKQTSKNGHTNGFFGRGMGCQCAIL